MDFTRYYGFRFGFLSGFLFTILMPRRMFDKLGETYYNITENEDIK